MSNQRQTKVARKRHFSESDTSEPSDQGRRPVKMEVEQQIEESEYLPNVRRIKLEPETTVVNNKEQEEQQGYTVKHLGPCKKSSCAQLRAYHRARIQDLEDQLQSQTVLPCGHVTPSYCPECDFDQDIERMRRLAELTLLTACTILLVTIVRNRRRY